MIGSKRGSFGGSPRRDGCCGSADGVTGILDRLEKARIVAEGFSCDSFYGASDMARRRSLSGMSRILTGNSLA